MGRMDYNAIFYRFAFLAPVPNSEPVHEPSIINSDYERACTLFCCGAHQCQQPALNCVINSERPSELNMQHIETKEAEVLCCSAALTTAITLARIG